MVLVKSVASINGCSIFQDTITHGILTEIHDGQIHVGNYFSDVFKNLPVGIGWGHLNDDGTDTIWDGCNLFEVALAGCRNESEFLGTTTGNLAADEETTRLFIAQDRSVIIDRKPLLNKLDVMTRKKEVCVLLSSTKIPIYDSMRNVSGLLGFFTDVTGLRQSAAITIKNMMSVCFDDILASLQSKKNYYISTDKHPIRLTAKQAACLTHLSMGKTIKQISSTLDCSSRTIEDHINLLKRKLGVYSTAELIDCFWCNPIRWF